MGRVLRHTDTARRGWGGWGCGAPGLAVNALARSCCFQNPVGTPTTTFRHLRRGDAVTEGPAGGHGEPPAASGSVRRRETAGAPVIALVVGGLYGFELRARGTPVPAPGGGWKSFSVPRPLPPAPGEGGRRSPGERRHSRWSWLWARLPWDLHERQRLLGLVALDLPGARKRRGEEEKESVSARNRSEEQREQGGASRLAGRVGTGWDRGRKGLHPCPEAQGAHGVLQGGGRGAAPGPTGDTDHPNMP